jgi:hypothetical protein
LGDERGGKDCAPPSLAALVRNAGSRGTGNPSRVSVRQEPGASVDGAPG